MQKLLPIRKVTVGLVAAGLYYAAHKAGLAFTDADANQAAQGLVGFVVAYIVPDPRVQTLATRVSLLDKLRTLNAIATSGTSILWPPDVGTTPWAAAQPPAQEPVHSVPAQGAPA